MSQASESQQIVERKPYDPHRGAAAARNGLLLLVIAYLGFISLGLPDPVAGVAWPSVREHFGLHQNRFGLVFIALGCGYCLSGFFGGTLTRVLGLGNLLWVSSALVAVAMLGSGLTPAWALFVGCGVIWGLGSGGIDAGLNAYVSKHFSARHMNWLHACYSLGATLGPLLMTAMLVRLGSWRLGYGVVGGILLAMALLFLVTRERWDDPPKGDSGADPSGVDGEQRPTAAAEQGIGMRQVMADRLVWFHVALFFFYVGLEFTVGQWCFSLLTESRGVPTNVAGMLASAYYGAIGVGRILSGVIAPRVGLDPLLRGTMGVALVGAAVYAFASPVWLSSAGLVLIGLGLAPVFPCLMSKTPERLGAESAAHAVGFQVSAGMLGAALVPGLAGLLVERMGLEFVTRVSLTLAILLVTTHEILLRLPGRRN